MNILKVIGITLILSMFGMLFYNQIYAKNTVNATVVENINWNVNQVKSKR